MIVDVKDRSAPKLIAHRMWAPSVGGATHNCLPLPDRDLLMVLDEATLDNMDDGYKPIWIFDIKEPPNPRCLATLPTPSDRNYVEVGGHFGPHNIYENWPGHFVSSDIVFTTYQNAGVRVFDIRNQYAPVEVGAMVVGAAAHAGRPASQPAARPSRRRRLCRQGWACLCDGFQRWALHHGIQRIIARGRSASDRGQPLIR